MRFAPALLCFLWCATAWSFSISLQQGGEIRWPNASIEYELQQDGCDDIQDGTDLAAIRSAVKSWNNVACSSLELIEAASGQATDTIATTGELDGINRLTWIEDERWPYGSLVLGVATPVYDAQGQILEADITLNGYSASWSTTGEENTGDIESVVVHELGHVFGLQHVLGGHNLGSPPTMSAIMDPNLRGRDLEDDDALGACYLYPAEDYRCLDGCDCPRILERNLLGQERYVGQLNCVDGSCNGLGEVLLGQVVLGGACAFEDECADGLFCGPTGYGAYCSQPCALDTPCPEGFECWYWEGVEANGGACMPLDLDELGASNAGACLAKPVSTVPCWCDQDDECDVSCECDTDCSGGCSCSSNQSSSALLWLFPIFWISRRFYLRFRGFRPSMRCS